MNLLNKVKYLYMRSKGMPLHLILQKLYERFLKTLLRDAMQRFKDRYNGTFCTVAPYKNLNFNMHRILQSKFITSIDESNKNQYMAICNLYTKNHFDILGTGWIPVSIGHESNGFFHNKFEKPKENISLKNQAYTFLIKDHICSDYQYINWHYDFKSNYTWPLDWYKKIQYANEFGVDIKVPWELSRLQHLPQLAIAYNLESSSQYLKQKYLNTFQNQLLDFIAHNPPRYGVNWVCTMDVAIRAANIVFAYSIFNSGGAIFKEKVNHLILNSLEDHKNHIIKNLEWTEGVRGNHYLSDICGLIILLLFLPDSKENLCLMLFALNEFIDEVDLQFDKDGANFEGSTCYHCLSAEMVGYTYALINSISKEHLIAINSSSAKLPFFLPKKNVQSFNIVNGEINLFSETLKNKIRNIPFLIDASIIDSQNYLQVGDNDSGRFFKFHPKFQLIHPETAKMRYANLKALGLTETTDYYIENHLDYESVLSLFKELFYKIDNTSEKSSTAIIPSIVKAISSKTEEQTYLFSAEYLTSQVKNMDFKKGSENFTRFLSNEYKAKSDIKHNLKSFFFYQFGLFIWKSDNLFLSIVCGDYGQNRNGGHSHNDQLSIELWIDGKNIFRDPGTYLYTPSLKDRNNYRSYMNHSSPQITSVSEPASINEGCFYLRQRGESKVITSNGDHFIGLNTAFGFNLYREIIIHPKKVVINDSHDGPMHHEFIPPKKIPFSHGYGWQEK